MINALPPVQPGVYPGPGLASVLRANGQQYLWQGQALTAGVTTSIAIQLERLPAKFYPWGAAFEVAFSASPGTFEIDIQFAETDADANFVTVGTITSVNGTFVGRYDMPNTVWPKFVRAFAKTFPNPVTATLLLTR